MFNRLESLSKSEGESIENLPISRLVPFNNSPFEIYTGERKENLINHIKENGLINPVTVHKESTDGIIHYRIVCGANRVDAFRRLNNSEIPCIIKENLSDNELNAIMVGDNLFRREIGDMKPSMLGKALRILSEANNRQGKRSDLENSTSNQIEGKLDTASAIGQDYKLSASNVRRYIRLTYLNDVLLKTVDDGKMPINTAVAISYLKQGEQKKLSEIIDRYKISISIAEELKCLSQESSEDIDVKAELDMLCVSEKKVSSSIKFSQKDFKGIAPRGEIITKEIIVQALRQFYKA
jgi:ParB family chromosome partitioning protein